MLDGFYASMADTPVAVTILAIAIMLMGGFGMTRLTKLCRLPNVTGYILAGILMGPYCLGLVPSDVVAGMDFLADIALALIAFGMGEFFRFSVLRKNGPKVALCSLIEVMAVADDGLIEATYLPGYKYLRAYQWHPERLVEADEHNEMIIEDFIAACRER